MKNIAIIGSGTWGVALGIHLSNLGNKIKIWSFTDEETNLINIDRKCKFLPNAVMFGFLDGKLEQGSIQNLYDNIKNAGADPKYESRVDVLFIDGTVALARVLEDNWVGHDFSDYLMMVKIGDDWKIVAKVYNQLPKSA